MNTQIEPGTEEIVARPSIEEIGARYESVTLGQRLKTLVRGLGQPHGTRAYKAARIELQRLAAPLAAVVLVVLLVAVLIVVTAVSAQKTDVIEVQIATLEPDPVVIDPIPEEPDEPPDVKMDEPLDAFALDTTDLSPPSLETVAPPSPTPGGEPTRLVAAVPSPVTMAAVVGTSKPRGLGDGSGFGTALGSGAGRKGLPEGALLGEIIDLKRNAKGEDRTAALGSLHATRDYWERVNEMFRGRFSPESCREVYRLPMRVALTSLWVPPQSADNGPAAFGADKLMEPKYWVAHYWGSLTPTKDIRCRFIGYFDDLLVVAVDGKVVLDVHWAMDPAARSVTTGWKSPDPAASRFAAPQAACRMIVGDWVTFKAGRTVQLDIACGEKPGGAVGGLLCIEEEGAAYDRMPDGRPKWPIFTTVPLSERQKQTFEKVGYGIGINPPRFNYRPKVDAREVLKKTDVGVDVSI